MTIRRPFSGAIRTTPVTKAAVRAPIGPQGGTLTARHAGVTFTLTVPPGALAARTNIAMTPIAAIHGLPLSGRAAAVRFGPEGLTFAAPATLTVRGVRGKLIGFTAGARARGLGSSGHGASATVRCSRSRISPPRAPVAPTQPISPPRLRR